MPGPASTGRKYAVTHKISNSDRILDTGVPSFYVKSPSSLSSLYKDPIAYAKAVKAPITEANTNHIAATYRDKVNSRLTRLKLRAFPGVDENSSSLGVFRTEKPFGTTNHLANQTVTYNVAKGGKLPEYAVGFDGRVAAASDIKPDTRSRIPKFYDFRALDADPYFETVNVKGQKWNPLYLFQAAKDGKYSMKDIRDIMRMGDVARGGSAGKVLQFGDSNRPGFYASVHPEQAPRWFRGAARIKDPKAQGVLRFHAYKVDPAMWDKATKGMTGSVSDKLNTIGDEELVQALGRRVDYAKNKYYAKRVLNLAQRSGLDWHDDVRAEKAFSAGKPYFIAAGRLKLPRNAGITDAERGAIYRLYNKGVDPSVYTASTPETVHDAVRAGRYGKLGIGGIAGRKAGQEDIDAIYNMLSLARDAEKPVLTPALQKYINENVVSGLK